jgi:LEA14-like dessication related protein
MKFSILATTLLLCITINGCRPFQSLEYKGISDWDIKPKSFVETKLSATINIYNPNKYEIRVRRIEANIDVEGNSWSHYKVDSAFTVPALSAFAFPVDMMVKNSYLINGAMRIASGKELPYQLKGKIRGTYRNITAEVPFEYSGHFTESDIKF